MSSERRPARARLASALVVALVAAPLLRGIAVAQEETTWSQYQGGPAHEGFAPGGPQPRFRVRWTLPTPAGVSLSPAGEEGNVALTVRDAAVYGLDIASREAACELRRAGGPRS